MIPQYTSWIAWLIVSSSATASPLAWSARIASPSPVRPMARSSASRIDIARALRCCPKTPAYAAFRAVGTIVPTRDGRAERPPASAQRDARSRLDTSDPPGLDAREAQIAIDGRDRLRRNGREQSAGRLGIVGDRDRLVGDPADIQRRLDEPAVVSGAPCLDAGASEVEHTRQHRQRPCIEDEPRLRRARHLERVTEETEPGDVRRRADAVTDQDGGRREVQRRHLRYGDLEVLVARQAAASTAHEEYGAETLRQHESVAGPGPALPQQLRGIRGAHDGEALLGLGVPDRVTARQHAAGLDNLARRGAEDRRQRLVRELLGKRGDREREEDAAAHREDVGQRVGRRDLTVGDRIVDERRKEVDGPEDREIVGDAVGGGSVGRVEAR